MQTQYIHQSILLVFLTFCCFKLQSQEISNINNLYFDRASLNSAYIIQDDPNDINLSVSSSLGGGQQDLRRLHMLFYTNYSKLEVGVGLRINSAFYGLFNTTLLETMYAKDFSINDQNRFSIGLNFGMQYTGINRAELNSYVQTQDPFLDNNRFPEYRFIAGLGAAYQLKDKLDIGFSIPNLLKTQNDFRPDFVVNTKAYFSLSDIFSLDPEILVYGNQASGLVGELNTTFTYYDIAGLVLGARSNRTLLAGFIWTREVLTIGYIYQSNGGKFQQISTGIHNLNVGYVF